MQAYIEVSEEWSLIVRREGLTCGLPFDHALEELCFLLVTPWFGHLVLILWR